jgi:hypothetical protein
MTSLFEYTTADFRSTFADFDTPNPKRMKPKVNNNQSTITYFEQFKDINSESPFSKVIELANKSTDEQTKGLAQLVKYLLEKIEKLENHIRYMPDGEGYEDAKTHFENLVVEKEGSEK